MAPQALVETSLYGDDLDALKAFYTQTLGLMIVAQEPDRHVFLRVGPAQMLLLFNPETTMRPGPFPTHGTRGPGHLALGIPRHDLEDWRTHLQERGVPIEKEITWPLGGHSLYFRDPAGNSVELLTPGVWGTPTGW